jgi:hypothetical protein
MFGHSAFSETALGSASVNIRVIPDALSATTAVGDVTINFGATIVQDDGALTATTAVGDVAISISCRVDATGLESVGELGDVRVYGLVVPGIDEIYTPEVPDSDSNYQRIAPAPAREWNDLVT